MIEIKWPWNDPQYLNKRVEIDLKEQRNYSEQEFIEMTKPRCVHCNNDDPSMLTITIKGLIRYIYCEVCGRSSEQSIAVKDDS